MATNPQATHQSFFHTTPIKKGVYGELSKIQEELEEAFDAQNQGQELMMLIELADMVGAIEGVSLKYGFNIEQLLKFARLRSEVAIKESTNEVNNDLIVPFKCEVIAVTNVIGKGTALSCKFEGNISADDILVTNDNEHINILFIEKIIGQSNCNDINIIIKYDFEKAQNLVNTILTKR